MSDIDTCSFCEIIVKVCDTAMCFDLCNKWIHVKSNNINDLDYENCKLRNESCYCKECIQE